MATTYHADSVDGSTNPTGEAKQEYGHEGGTTFSSDLVEAKVVDAPEQQAPKTRARASTK